MRNPFLIALLAASLGAGPALAATPGQPTSADIAAGAAQEGRKAAAMELAAFVTGQGIANTSSRNLLDNVIGQMFEQNAELVRCFFTIGRDAPMMLQRISIKKPQRSICVTHINSQQQ